MFQFSKSQYLLNLKKSYCTIHFRLHSHKVQHKNTNLLCKYFEKNNASFSLVK